MRKRLIWIVPLVILGIVIFVWIGGQVVMLLWNWLAPTLFGLRQITFWQALGLLALCRILFGGHSFGAHRRRRTAEERERFRQAMQTRFGCAGPASGERQ